MLTTLLLTHALMTTPVQQDPVAEFEKKLLQIGTMAPNFTVKDDNGKEFDLYKSLKEKKAKGTILTFWFAG
ncbi:MAG: hypothetical protein IH945_01005 [Armatimonadetes bacterium]|nr:hypothetical protein [Armatimonadota bacterium]